MSRHWVVSVTRQDLVRALAALGAEAGAAVRMAAGLCALPARSEVLARPFKTGHSAYRETPALLVLRGMQELPWSDQSLQAILAVEPSGSCTRINGFVRDEAGNVQRATTIRLVGPGMLTIPGDAQQALPRSPVHPRWSRVVGALGRNAWERMRSARAGLVGCGRLGSQVAEGLARSGIGSLDLIDPDRLEAHNLDSVGVATSELGQLKADAAVSALQASLGDVVSLSSCAKSAGSPEATHLLKAGDVLVSAPDRDDARWVTSIVAALYLKPHLDLGARIEPPDSRPTVLFSDVRLTLPGEACLLCFGGLAHDEEVAAFKTAGPAGPSREWWETRAGSLPSLNQIAAGIGSRLIEELYAGRLTRSIWVRVSFTGAAEPTCEVFRSHPAARCALCALAGLGDFGLERAARIPSAFPPAGGSIDAPM